jgi:general secretion pathway protein J
MRPPARGLAQHGFTLVEVLVALMIMAVLAGMAWQGIDGITRTRDATAVRMEQTLRINTVLQQWEQDLQALYDPPDKPLVPPLSFDGATLRAVRRADAGVQLVAWSLRDGRWLRWSGPVVTRAGDLQDSWMRSQQLLGNEPAQLVTLEGIETWQVYFFRGNSWSNAQSSADVEGPAAGASAPQREVLPTGVRLVLGFGGRIPGPLTRDVLLAPQTP